MFAPSFRYHSEDNVLSGFRFDIGCARSLPGPIPDIIKHFSEFFPVHTSFFGMIRFSHELIPTSATLSFVQIFVLQLT